MKIKNAYLKKLFRRTEELAATNRYLLDTSRLDGTRHRRAVDGEVVRGALVNDIGFYNKHIELRITPKEPRLTAFFLKIIWLDDPKTLFRQWSVIDMGNINLTEYSKLAYEKIKDNTIDKSFMKEFKSVVKLLC